MALAWVGIPPLVRWQIEARGTAKLGRAVTVERVRFTPWNLRTTLDGLAVAGLPGAAAPQVEVARLGFRTALSSLWQGAPVIEDLDIAAPRLRVARLSLGHYDIDDVIARLANPQQPETPPARYVLRQLQLAQGTIDFDDRAVSGPTALHTVRELQLGLPAISSLGGARQEEVVPTLAFVLDGSRFDSRAEALPFAELRKGEATLKVAGLDLARLQGYWPASLPLRPVAGRLDAELKMVFAQNPRPGDALLHISGALRLQGLSLQAAGGGEPWSVGSTEAQIADLAPLQRILRLERLVVSQPHVDIVREASGRLALLPAPAAAGSSAPAASGPAAAAVAPWKVELAHLQIRQGAIGWRDASTPVPVKTGIEALEIDATGLAWPLAAPATVRGSASLAGSGPAAAKLAWSGTVGPGDGRLQVQAQGLPLALAQAYLPGRLRPQMRGTLGLDGAFAWSPGGIKVDGGKLTIDDLALAQDGSTLAGARRVALEDLRLDTAQHRVSAGRLDVTAPLGQVSRDARGTWMFADWWMPAPGTAATSVGNPSAPAPWTLSLKELQIDQGRFGWRDARSSRPVAIDLSGVRLQSHDLQWPLRKASALPIQLAATVAAGQSTPGSLRFDGSVQPEPWVLDGRLDASRLPLQAVEPYFADTLNVQIVRADLGFAGKLRLALPPAGLQLSATGDASVDNGRVDSATPDAPAQGAAAAAPKTGGVLTPGARRATSLFTWRTLQLKTMTFRTAPGQPIFFGVYDSTLGDFFARLAINENGRLNLRELTRAPAGAAPATSAPAGKAVPSAAPPELHFGQIHLVHGRVQFTDNYVKPSYTASLSELEGVLGAFDSVGAVYLEPAMATLDLKGKAEGTASIDISGKLNPLANPLAIDIVAKVDDLDLPALSPYAVKYMGHGIQRGKLSMDVHYKIQPNGTLTAENSLVLRQLVFDEQADGAASNLPVRLAAALLADRNGVIDLNLPISGSLNDPQFSLAPVIAKALGNLVLRAVTSPFSLISNIFSGPSSAAEASSVAFTPGSAELEPAATQDLDRVAQALVARPALQLTISGSASADAETDAMRRERLRQLARSEKRRELIAAAPTAAPPAAAQVTMTDAEYPALLKRVYAATDMPKPRNLIGMDKSLPTAEMERLLAAQVDVGDDQVRSLALQRGAAVRDYLAAHGVPTARVFLGAVQLDQGAKPDWKPQAQLRLSAH